MTPLDGAGLLVMAATWGACAILLGRSGVRYPAWLLGAGVVTVGAGLLLERTGTTPIAVWLLVALLLAPLAVLLYPRPRADSRAVDAGAAGLLVLAWLAALLIPGEAGIVPAAITVLGVVVVHLWWRFERLSAAERGPLLWLVPGLSVPALVTFGMAFVLADNPVSGALTLASYGILPVSMVVGVRRPDIMDARGIIVASSVLCVASTACVALYITVASLLTVTTGTAPEVGLQGIIACGCALAFPPLRRLLHATVDELLFGRRPDPLSAAVKVADTSLTDPEDLVNQIRHALVLPYVAVQVGDDDVVSSGVPTPHIRRFALDHLTGTLVVGLRPGDLHLSRAETEVLTLVARLVGQTGRAEALATALARSRTAIRSAIEEERRRLRRELHDGLGPTLTGIAFTADAVANLTADRSSEVADLLGAIRDEASQAIEDIRRIAHDIRPPALDQLGLHGAITQHVHVLRRADLDIVLDVQPDTDQLPAATEVAAYRIITEALTNAARHASPSTITILVTRLDDELRITVTNDDPDRDDRGWDPGVGLTSMRERAEELGGRLTAGPTPHGGRVEARLPIA